MKYRKRRVPVATCFVHIATWDVLVNVVFGACYDMGCSGASCNMFWCMSRHGMFWCMLRHWMFWCMLFLVHGAT